MAESDDKKKQLLVIGLGLFLGMIVIIVILVVVLNRKPEARPSALPPVSANQEEPSKQQSEAYKQSIDDFNARKKLEAETGNKTALPVFSPKEEGVKPKKEGPQFGGAQGTGYGNNDLDAQRQMQREQARSTAVMQQLNQLMNGWQAPKSAGVVTAQQATTARADGTTQPAAQNVSVGNTTKSAPSVLKGASDGDFAFSELEGPIDSDKPDLVLATIKMGPLQGAQIRGKFTRKDEFINIQLTSLKFNGKSYAINAVGLDINTFNSYLTGEVDSRWMERFGWPFMTGMISGFGQAAAATSTSTTVGIAGVTAVTSTPNSRQIAAAALGQGMNAVGQQISRNSSNIEKRVFIAAHTPFAIYFLKDTVEDGTAPQSQSVEMQQAAQQQSIQQVAQQMQTQANANGQTPFNGYTQRNYGVTTTGAVTVNQGSFIGGGTFK